MTDQWCWTKTQHDTSFPKRKWRQQELPSWPGISHPSWLTVEGAHRLSSAPPPSTAAFRLEALCFDVVLQDGVIF